MRFKEKPADCVIDSRRGLDENSVEIVSRDKKYAVRVPPDAVRGTLTARIAQLVSDR